MGIEALRVVCIFLFRGVAIGGWLLAIAGGFEEDANSSRATMRRGILMATFGVVSQCVCQW